MADLVEAKHEQKFVRSIEARGFEALKLRIDGQDGFPDRTVIMDRGVFFVEFKRTAKDKLRPQQRRWKKRLESLGHSVFVAWSFDQAERYFEKWYREKS